MELHDPMWRAIVRHLQSTRSDSISGIARAISDGRDKPIHRLTVAGYLQIMAELGMLREVSRPPSIHYQLLDPRKHRSIYEMVHDAIEGHDRVPRNRITCGVLQHLFQRPIFLAELHQAGCTDEGLERKSIGDDARRNLRERVQTNARLALPTRDPLLHADAKPADIQDVIRVIALESTRSDGLRHEGNKAHQTSLEVNDA